MKHSLYSQVLLASAFMLSTLSLAAQSEAQVSLSSPLEGGLVSIAFTTLDTQAKEAFTLDWSDGSNPVTLTPGLVPQRLPHTYEADASPTLQLTGALNLLSSLDLTAMPLTIGVLAEGNALTQLTTSATPNTSLHRLDASNNQLSQQNLQNYTLLQTVDLAHNQLTELLLSDEESVEHVDCSDNCLDFSSLPDFRDISRFNYAPQAALTIQADSVNGKIDLSRQMDISSLDNFPFHCYTTGIESFEVPIAIPNNSNVTYDLQGRPAKANAKGLLINKNGKIYRR